MAESIGSDGQNQQVPSELYGSGYPPTLIKSNLDSPLSPVSSEDLDFISSGKPLSEGHGNTPDSYLKQENIMETNQMGRSNGFNQVIDSGNTGSGTDSGSPRRSKPIRTETDIMKLSAMSGDGNTDSISSSRPASAASSRSPYKEKEAEKRLREKEKEERFKLARQRMAEERQKKLIELKEQQRIAQVNRERQLELRRKKIEDLRRREDDRRTAVEERRLNREATERTKREAILQRASDRMTRYEAWKTGGRKGGIGQVSGFGSRTPRGICSASDRPKRSSSHSALIRRSPNSSDYGYMSPQRRAISACSSVRRHCCVDINRIALNTIPESRRSFLAPSSSPPQRPKSTVSLSTSSGTVVKMRETKSPRKPRPASVATSMPSFIYNETPKSSSQRSISTDRLAKDKHQKNKNKDEPEEKKSKRVSVKFSRDSMDRLSAPKPRDPMTTSVEMPKRESIVKRSPRKAYSTTNLAMSRKSLPANIKLSKETPTRSLRSSEVDDKKIAVVKPSPSVVKTTVPPIKQSIINTTPKTQSIINTTPKTQSIINTTPKTQPTSTVAPVETVKGERKDVDDYKARLAEHRRLAREKAEKEAEEERRKDEIKQLLEEEKERQEEEEQIKLEEESLRLAAEARKIEEERLEKAIEAESKRREEEAQRFEEEKKAKELADQKAQEEAEQLERERLERAKKEEVERVERKKRLEMIMKRVKTEGPSDAIRMESPSKLVTSSPSKSVDSLGDGEEKTGKISNANSEEEITKPSIDTSDSSQFQTPDKLTVTGDKARFISPLLQHITENKSDSPGDRPKFKSPLLQNLLGKNKSGAKVGLEKSIEESRVGEILNTLKSKETLSFSSSQSLTNLSQSSDSLADKESLEKNLSKSVFHINMKDEDKDIDTTESENSSVTDAGQNLEDVNSTVDNQQQQLPLNNRYINNDGDNKIDSNGYPDHTVEIDQENGDMSSCNNLENGITLIGGADSGVLMDLGESATSLQSIPVNGSMPHDLIDSSISMHSVDSNVSESKTSNDFEELIDLSISTKNNVDLKTSQLPDSLKDASNDLLNFNNFEESEERENRTPFIAFEDNTNRKQDVPDLLS